MKTLILAATTAGLLIGCASTDNTTASNSGGAPASPAVGEAMNDQPQTSVAGEGSLMPGAYDTRRMQTGQFTGRERTNDMIGQRPTLPREADPRELTRTGNINTQTADGAGTLGQTGIVPDEPVTSETILEDAPAQAGSVGAPPVGDQGSARETNSIVQPPTSSPE